jgi:serine/threonine-protein kinase
MEEKSPIDWCRDALPGYEVERELGRGAMGIVLLATQKGLGRHVAIKMLAAGFPEHSDLARFKREARTYARLSHPNLVKVYDADLVGTVPYIVLEYLEGSDLRSSLIARRRLDPVAVGRDLARATAYIHERGILHRDIKPANIFLRDGRQPVLVDFGLAKAVSPDVTALTESGQVVGTPSYLAPEVLQGTPPSARADVYSLGLVLYELAAARPVFLGVRDSGHETIGVLRRMRGAIPGLREAGVRVDARLDELIASCVAMDPDRRPDAALLASRLELLSRNEGGRAPRPAAAALDPSPRAPGAASSWKTRSGLTAATVALVCLAIFGSRGAGPPQQEPLPATPRPAAVPSGSASLAPEIRSKDGAEMLLVPAGWFQRGPLEGVAGESKARRVHLPAFYIDRYEVTNRLYDRFCAQTGHRPRVRFTDRSPDFDASDHPVVGVDWDDAVQYCRWANKRLPTEDEWEKAARGTDGRTYPWGNDLPGAVPVANFRDRSKGLRGSDKPPSASDYSSLLRPDDGFPFTAPVGRFRAGASPYKALDMAGNVAEWCVNLHDPGQGWIVRGGSWRTMVLDIACTSRDGRGPAAGRSIAVGFRGARSGSPAKPGPPSVP